MRFIVAQTQLLIRSAAAGGLSQAAPQVLAALQPRYHDVNALRAFALRPEREGVGEGVGSLPGCTFAKCVRKVGQSRTFSIVGLEELSPGLCGVLVRKPRGVRQCAGSLPLLGEVALLPSRTAA